MVDLWNVAGLRGTGSFSFQVDDLFVPEERTFVQEGPSWSDAPLYGIPTTLLFATGFATVALGVARKSLDIAIDVGGSRTPYRSGVLLRDHQTTQRTIGEAHAQQSSARAFLREAHGRLWESACTGAPSPPTSASNSGWRRPMPSARRPRWWTPPTPCAEPAAFSSPTRSSGGSRTCTSSPSTCKDITCTTKRRASTSWGWSPGAFSRNVHSRSDRREPKPSYRRKRHPAIRAGPVSRKILAMLTIVGVQALSGFLLSQERRCDFQNVNTT